MGGGGAGEAAGFELTFESGAIGLGGATSEVFDVVGGQGAIHGTIVAYARRSCPMPRPLCASDSPLESGGGGGFLLREAFAAEYRTSLRGAERDSGFLAAL